jgi:hypothetical protein
MYDYIEITTITRIKKVNFLLEKSMNIISSSDISKTISYNSLGRIYKPASTLKDSLENPLKRIHFDANFSNIFESLLAEQ